MEKIIFSWTFSFFFLFCRTKRFFLQKDNKYKTPFGFPSACLACVCFELLFSIKSRIYLRQKNIKHLCCVSLLKSWVHFLDLQVASSDHHILDIINDHIDFIFDWLARVDIKFLTEKSSDELLLSRT